MNLEPADIKKNTRKRRIRIFLVVICLLLLVVVVEEVDFQLRKPTVSSIGSNAIWLRLRG